jgi:alcohol dehydrogenase class IV
MLSGSFVCTATHKVDFGRPAAVAIAEAAAALGARRAFIIASSTLAQHTDEITTIEQALGAAHAGTFAGIGAHVPRADVIAAAAAARAAGADLIVAVGGGSVQDAAKIVPLALKHNWQGIDDFDAFTIAVSDAGEMIKPVFTGPDVRVVAVPTTLSGGEFNPLSGATDERVPVKQPYEHRDMAPAVVVLDPAVARHTPEWLFLSTGVRALDHAIETLQSLLSNPVADAAADNALRLLCEGLPRVKADPLDLEARLLCQMGAWQSMLPITAGVPMGASHAIGHMLGGTAKVPHGYTSCVMTPYVLRWNESVNAARQQRIAAAFGDPHGRAGDLADAFIASLGMPRTLTAVGVREDQLPIIAEHTLGDMWGRTNPRPIRNADDVLDILRSAL